jgi:enoyl-CoA hydratase/carnithine racemase
VIAAVHGYCLGHAFGTALYCDHLVATRDAQFEFTEVRLGLPPASFLPRLGLPAFAREVAMTGRRFSAEEAWEAGIVTRLVAEGQHLRAAEELARQILENPQRAVRQNVRARRLAMDEDAARYQASLEGFDWATSSEAREAIAKLTARGRDEV